VDEPFVPDPNDWIRSGVDPTEDTCKLKLTGIGTPLDGPVTLYIQFRSGS
jgi:hypothetical protein